MLEPILFPKQQQTVLHGFPWSAKIRARNERLFAASFYYEDTKRFPKANKP
jgi:hypothetical protein